MKLIRKTKGYFAREKMLAVCAALALASMFFVPPDAAYWGYIDYRVIGLLFSLMAIVLGMQERGLFRMLAQALLKGEKSFRAVSLLLVMLPFFCSMLVTNDVALLTFVPFAIIVLEMTGRTKMLIRIVVLQTIAANLGSMATPFGSPHDLFVYEYYALGAGEYFALLLPYVALSLVVLAAAALCTKGDEVVLRLEKSEKCRNPRLLWAYGALFALCLLSVFRVVNAFILTGAVLAFMLIVDRKLLKKVDYSLLLIFLCFFVFAGNMGRLPAVRSFLTEMLDKSTLLSAVAASQLISNVPASVLLAGFTDDWRGLLIGVNIGGLGTPIASLASLISLKLYLQTKNARPLRYLGYFTLANVLTMAVLLLFYELLG